MKRLYLNQWQRDQIRHKTMLGSLLELNIALKRLMINIEKEWLLPIGFKWRTQ